MPQLDSLTYISQAFWMLLCFCLLWWLLSCFVTPKLADIAEQRKRKLDEYIHQADKLNAQAKNSLDKYNKALVKAQQQAQVQIEQGRADLREYLDKTEQNLVADLNKKIADTEFILAQEKKETMLQIEQISQDLAFNIVQKIGFNEISKEDIANISTRNFAND